MIALTSPFRDIAVLEIFATKSSQVSKQLQQFANKCFQVIIKLERDAVIKSIGIIYSRKGYRIYTDIFKFSCLFVCDKTMY